MSWVIAALLLPAPSAADELDRNHVVEFYKGLGLRPRDRYTWPDVLTTHVNTRLVGAMKAIAPRMPSAEALHGTAGIGFCSSRLGFLGKRGLSWLFIGHSSQDLYGFRRLVLSERQDLAKGEVSRNHLITTGTTDRFRHQITLELEGRSYVGVVFYDSAGVPGTLVMDRAAEALPLMDSLTYELYRRTLRASHWP
jgi:hypothetical protein